MRLHRVLVPRLVEGETVLVGPEAHHLRDVLRIRAGASVEAFDGHGAVADGEVVGATRDGVTLRLSAPRPSAAEAPLRVTVAVALLKGDKLSDVVRPATELGVAAFCLLATRNVDVPTLSPARVQRLARVAQEAARQCGRAVVPEVVPPVPLDALRWQGLCLVADPDATTTLSEAASRLALDRLADEGGSVTLVTGPEGGLDADEVASLVARGAHSVRFGPRILRAETAPVAFAAALLVRGGR